MAEEDVKIVAKIEADASQASTEINKVQKSLQGVSDNAKKVQKSTADTSAGFSKLKDTLSDISPAAQKASEGANVFNQALNVLKANPIIAVIAAIVLVVVALFNQFKKMESVSDALGKAFGVFSGILKVFTNAVLTPLIDGFVKLVSIVTSAATALVSVFSPAVGNAANRIGELTEALDDLDDAEANSAISRAESNRKLQEAREIAQDANVPIKQRIAALKEAGKIEKEEMTNAMTIAQTRAKLMLEQIAIELGARDTLVQAIRNGSIEQLKAARNEIMAMQNVDKEKLKSIDALIIQAEEQGAQLAKVQKKTNSAIDSLEKEEEAKRKEARAKALEDRKKYLAEKERIEREHQDRLKKINEDGEKAIQAAISELRKTSLQNEIKALDNEFNERIAAANKAGLSTFDIIQAYNLKKNEVRDKFIATEKEATDKADADKFAAQADFLNKNSGLLNQNLQNEIANREAAIRIAEIEKQEKIKQLNEYATATSQLSDLIGKQTIAGKALGIATATINTWIGVTEALKQKSTLPSPFDYVAKAINVGAIVASGINAVRNITKVNVPGGGGSVGGGLTSAGAAITAPVTPTQTSTRLDSGSIQAVGNAAQGGVGRTYVLDSDIKNNNEVQQRLIRAARLS